MAAADLVSVASPGPFVVAIVCRRRRNGTSARLFADACRSRGAGLNFGCASTAAAPDANARDDGEAARAGDGIRVAACRFCQDAVLA